MNQYRLPALPLPVTDGQNGHDAKVTYARTQCVAKQVIDIKDTSGKNQLQQFDEERIPETGRNGKIPFPELTIQNRKQKAEGAKHGNIE
jgi:hypothetical protein